MKLPVMKNFIGQVVFPFWFSAGSLLAHAGFGSRALSAKPVRFHYQIPYQDNGAIYFGPVKGIEPAYHRPNPNWLYASPPLRVGAVDFPKCDPSSGLMEGYSLRKGYIVAEALAIIHFSGGDEVADKDAGCQTEGGSFGIMGCPDRDQDVQSGLGSASPDFAGVLNGSFEIPAEDQKAYEEAFRAVEFKSGTANLHPGSIKILDEMVRVLKKYPEMQLSIEGHTDSVGDKTKNQVLSLQRAEACKSYLVLKGIDAERLGTAGYGESKPVASNDTASGRQKNRRTEFKPTFR
jgi:outer membrane protein OmpA-like peptidoglycan-associated protein